MNTFDFIYIINNVISYIISHYPDPQGMCLIKTVYNMALSWQIPGNNHILPHVICKAVCIVSNRVRDINDICQLTLQGKLFQTAV